MGLSAKEYARRAMTRPMTPDRAQKLRDRLERRKLDVTDTMNAIEASHGKETRDSVSALMTQTRKRFR